MYFEKKLNESETKMLELKKKYFDFSNYNHARSELQTSNHNVHYHQIQDFLHVIFFYTNGVGLSSKLVS
jgi:hypothetical protein